MSIETLTYMGLPDCIKVSNGTVDVIATTAIGPRLLFYGATGGRNVLAHFPEATKETGAGYLEALWRSSPLGLARGLPSDLCTG